MGRPPAPWLNRAYRVLADGQWHHRDEVITEMVKTVPPGIARRRGTSTVRRQGLSDQELVRRGARHIAAGSLNDSVYIEKHRGETGVLLRLATTTAVLEAVAHCPTCTCNGR